MKKVLILNRNIVAKLQVMNIFALITSSATNNFLVIFRKKMLSTEYRVNCLSHLGQGKTMNMLTKGITNEIKEIAKWQVWRFSLDAFLKKNPNSIGRQLVEKLLILLHKMETDFMHEF